MVQNLRVGKNELWMAYQDAGPVKHCEIMVELKAVGLYRHWLVVASKEGYDLKMAKAPLRDIFLRLMPESARHFGIEPKPNQSAQLFS